MSSHHMRTSSGTHPTHQSYGEDTSSSSLKDPIAYYRHQRRNRQKAVFNREMHIMLQNKFTELRWKHFPERPAKSIASIPCSFLGARQHKNSESEESDEEMSSGEVSSTDESSSEDSSIDTDDLESSSEESDDLDRDAYPQQAFGSDSLHCLLWYNEKSKIMNSGDCQCQGFCINRQIKREVCEGEQRTAPCDPVSNNLYRLHHYVIVITPPINFQLKVPSSIKYGGALYDFSGFSIFSHQRLDNVPDFCFRRYRMEYTVRMVPTPTPQNFWIKDIDLISDYIMKDLLELYDFDCGESRTSCCRSFHFMPRYIHRVPGTEVSELLGSDIILAHLLTSFKPLFDKPPSKLGDHWRQLSRSHRDAIVTQPEKRPRCLRVDDIYDPRRKSRSGGHHEEYEFPDISHKGKCKSDQRILTSKRYENLLKRIKILTKRVTAKPDDLKSKDKLAKNQEILNSMKNKVETSVDVVVSSKGFLQTGIFSDVCQQALLLPGICHHIKYHWSLGTLEAALNHTFKSRALLEISLTHESYETTFGTTPIHIKNSLSNCGVCEPFYGSFEKSHIRNKKKGLMALISTMSELGSQGESFSNIKFNESLEFLGDAVIDLVCSTRLFYLLPNKPEGTLSIFRSALVQNYHLWLIGKELEIQKYMLISDWRKMEEATSGCIESITAVVYLEDGLYEADKFISRLIFKDEELRKIWMQPFIHPLQAEYPEGDRFFIKSSNVLKKLVNFEKEIGITFRHIRVLAKAFTHPSAGLNTLTRGNNQRLEFLGDAVLKFIASDYVYKHFPDHNEGHLTLLRNSLISAKCQFRVACEMGLQQYIDFGTEAKMPKNAKEKLLADVFEAFVASVYVDRDLKYCKKICEVLLFTRLESVILNQDWIDPKSQLQSCCLTVPRSQGMSRYPKYKVLEELGNSDNKTFKVGVYLNKKRLGTGRGKSKRQAEMDAAADALKSNFFGVLRKQRRILNRKLGHRKVGWRERGNYPG